MLYKDEIKAKRAEYKQSKEGKISSARYDHSDKGRVAQARYRNSEKCRIGNRRRLEKVIDQIFSIIEAKCVICGYLDRRALQIDHINGDGTEERRHRSGYSYYLYILRHIHEGRYQILCANCNQIRRVENRKIGG